MFTPAHWAALLAEGAVVEIEPQEPEPQAEPKTPTAVTKPARKTKAVTSA
jgi:hypothetical protein